MAITRAQQARQMLKQGSEPVEQAGVMNYMPSEMVTVPKIAKSSPDTPTAKLAYITPKEEDILVDLNLYGSLDGKPNRGPGGIPSLEGDFGPGGKGSYDRSGADKDVSAFGDKGTGDYQISDRPEDKKAVSDYVQGKMQFQGGKKPGFFTGPGTLKQRQQVYNLQQRQNMIDRFINQRRKKLQAGLMDKSIPGVDTMTTQEMIDLAPSIAGMTDLYSQKTIDDVLAGNRQIDFFTPVEGFSTFGTLANIVGPKMAGPVTKEKLESLLGEINTLENIDPRDTTSKDLMKEFAPNQYEMVYGTTKGGEGGQQQVYVPPRVTSDADDLEDDYYASVGGNPFKNRRALRLFNKGGIADTVVGGEFDFESARQMYGLGKLVKKVTRTVKKIAKSPVGKAALLYAGTAGLGSLATGGGMGSLFKLGTYAPGSVAANFPAIFTRAGAKNILFGGEKLLGNPAKGNLVPFSGIFGSGGKMSALKTIGIPTLLSYFMTPKPEDEDEDEDTYRGEKLDIAGIRRDPYAFIPRRFAAEGGITRLGFDDGDTDLSEDPNYKGWKKMYETNPDAAEQNENHKRYLNFYERNETKQAEGSKEPVAKKTMPLLDMGGKEMDLREEGGFVPIGRMEKADDVPARLSKNEFVFTADAVRNAGDGDVDLGAEKMYNMMKNLEAGGDVSEESQGLEGARKMFQTSQRLEEVI